MTSLATRWVSQFYAVLGDDRPAADDLRDASLQSNLAHWTSTLTGVVIRSFEQLGFAAAGKGYRCSLLPVQRNEYLAQDVMAFPSAGAGWRFPAAVCELENSADADLVAYSLWKVLCIHCGLRIVFCYRPEPGAGRAFVADLAAAVVDAIPIVERAGLAGETLVVVGSRNESSTFPYGFFQAWKLNFNGRRPGKRRERRHPRRRPAGLRQPSRDGDARRRAGGDRNGDRQGADAARGGTRQGVDARDAALNPLPFVDASGPTPQDDGSDPMSAVR